MKFPRVIVKLPNWIGDAVLAGPLVGRIREHWPKGHVAVAARPRVKEVAERLPGAGEVIGEPGGWLALMRMARRGDFDVAFSLSSTLAAPVAFALARVSIRVGFRGGGRTPFLTNAILPLPRSVHQVDHYLALGAAAGIARPKEPRLAWRVLPADRAEAAGFLSRNVRSARRLVALAPGATFGPAKRWFVASWARLADRLSLDAGAEIILVGGKDERETAGRIAARTARRALDATGALTLGGTAAVLARCHAFVSNDSGLMHVGTAVGVPTVGLFGSSNPHWTRPYGPRHAALWGHVPCSPCYRRTCLPGRDYACQEALSVDRVAAAVRERMG